MPSNLPSSFASAAAGQNTNSRGLRGDGRGPSGGDWSRRDGRPTNGTLTFRRAATTPTGQSSHQALPIEAPSPVVESPPHSSAIELPPARYSKDELLSMYRPQRAQDPSRLFFPGWDPSVLNGSHSRSWGKSNDNHVPQEPGACWESNGEVTPMGLYDMSVEEKEAFASDINSPLKPPTQNKDSAQGNVNGRKASLTQTTGNAFSINSASSTARPATRRRETAESSPFTGSALNSPAGTGRANRDEPSFWLPRKTGDVKEAEEEPQITTPGPRDGAKYPFGNLMRSHTTGSPSMAPGGWPPSTQPTTPGAGGFGAFAMPTSVGDKRAGGSGTSRLAHLMPKEASETKPNEAQNVGNQQPWRTRPRTDTDPFGEDGLSGSAVLGGAQDTSSGPQQNRTIGTLGTPVKGSAGDFGMSGLNLGAEDDEGQFSPSETNPYRSPHVDRSGQDDGDSEEKAQPHLEHLSLNFLNRGLEGSDRSQTSSVGAKGFPLPGVAVGWSATGPPIGTPDRERPNYGAAFGSSLFNPLGGDVQTPGVSNFNNVFSPVNASAIGTGSIGRGSKLAALLPAAMQSQNQSLDSENNLSDSVPDLRQANPLGAIGRNNFNLPARDNESPMRSERGLFGQIALSTEAARAQRAFNSGDSDGVGGPAFTPVSGVLPFGGTPGGEIHGNPVRQMVMPDRMRWVYLDPQGQIQGPFTGLEMNDWYKANFFTPDLRVKKVEDPDFEPLGQLIRRIGNSREPFLVPQIGIPHGPASQAGPFTASTQNGIVPPLSGIFPSFGRTLTAEEQNNLERRKQEEQFLMAQQREFMMRQQVMSKYGMGPGLQHQSSVQSLQSQPSFGSMTSPIGTQQGQQPSQQAPIGPAPPSGAFFDTPPESQATGRTDSGNGEHFREADFTNMTQEERQILASMSHDIVPGSSQPIGAPSSNLRAQIPNDQHNADAEIFQDRLREFDDMRAQHDAEEAQAARQLEASFQENERHAQQSDQREPTTSTVRFPKGSNKRDEEALLSLTQQVQNTQAAAASTVYSAAQPPEPSMPLPFPPPTSTTPLPAPTAQRVRSNLPEQYSRSQTGTPDDGVSQPPALAPWAKDPASESAKGPSLREIQEAQARKAAKAEEAAAALRRVAIEQEAAFLKEREKTAPVTTAGLPASSTWGHGSPVSASAATPWAKPAAVKMTTPGFTAPTGSINKKTLADIQREEEARKQKAKEAAISQGAPTGTAKPYASFSGKLSQFPAASSPAQPSTVPVASGWATVGAGGKVKVPTGSASQTPRSAGATVAKPISAAIKPTSRPGPAAESKSEVHVAMDEFNKWVGRELSRGIIGVSDVASFQATLDVLPMDSGIIADAVYANSTTMDGRHFAEEYIRRKKLAERGVVEKQPTDTGRVSNPGGGWSEVAKKGSNPLPPKETDSGVQAAGFKVVPSRKKGKK